MKHGIYYAFWEQEWRGDYIRYIKKVSALGFDILEIAAHQILDYSQSKLAAIRQCAADYQLTLTAGIGPPAEKNLSSPDPAVRRAGQEYLKATLKQLAKLQIHTIGGALYSYWPVDYSQPVDKEGDRQRGLAEIRRLAPFAADLGIDLCLEVLNRFENHILNTAAEGAAYVREVDQPNVKLMLDTFHLNIEEDSIGAAIRSAGPLLGHFHTGECNRQPPGKGRMPWQEIGEALREIHYSGAVVMEPFVKMGGAVGADIKVWRDLSGGASEGELDAIARDALVFSRYLLG